MAGLGSRHVGLFSPTNSQSRRQSILRFIGRICVFAAISGALLISGVTLHAAELKDPTEIIRSLAPIEYLPHHSGIRGPAIDLSIPFALGSAD